MKRLYIGVGLLIFILVAGVCLTAAFGSLHTPLSEKLDAAADAAMADEWEKTLDLTAEARAEWTRVRNFTAAVADHEPLEEMDSLFAQLEILAASRNRKDFAIVCAQLSTLATALAQSQAVTWWNLL